MIHKIKRHIHNWWHVYLFWTACVGWLFCGAMIAHTCLTAPNAPTEKKSAPKQDSSLVSDGTVTPSTAPDGYILPIGYIHNVPLDIDTQFFVQDLCKKYNLDTGMVYGIMYIESRFNNSAKNGSCVGIMQTDERYMSTWLRGEAWSSELHKNITAGIKSLAAWRSVCELRGHKDNVYYLLGTYNQGYTYFETHNDKYAQSVIEYAYNLKSYTIVKED